jgi:signal transduction histidine kinase
MSLFAISCLVTAVLTAILGLLTLFKNPKDRINRSWFLVSCAVFLWTIGLFGTVVVSTPAVALFCQRILYIGTILIPILFFNFTIILLKREKQARRVFWGGCSLAIIFLISLFSKHFITIVPERTSLNYWPVVAGLFYWSFLFYFALYMIYSLILLKIDSGKYSGIYQKQIQFVYYAVLIGFAGGSTNFLLDFDLNVYPVGNFFVSLYVILVAYAVFKYQLLNIRFIATEILVGLVSIILLIDLFLSRSSLQLMFLKSVILVVFVYLGISLIRSVLREIEYREKIRKAYEVEKKASGELKRLSDVKNQFIMASQHHLRTPLTSMRGYIDLVLTGSYGKVPPKIKEALTKFEISIKRLNKVINEFLDITQFQLGKEVVTLRDGVDLASIFKEVKEELGYEAKARGIKLEFKIPKNLPKIKADLEKLKIGMFNIIDNAIKYTQEGGVFIRVSTTDHRVLIEVKDTGVGIDKERQRDLFNRLFERGHDAMKVHGTGKGIGLFITAHIIKAHKGKIWARSEGHGKGSTFFIELPIK